MLVWDLHEVGNKLLEIRKRYGMTQAEVAEAAGLSYRAYADIERGTVNMHIETIMRICNALHITPNDILTNEDPGMSPKQEELMDRIYACGQKEKETALRLLSVYLRSLD